MKEGEAGFYFYEGNKLGWAEHWGWKLPRGDKTWNPQQDTPPLTMSPGCSRHGRAVAFTPKAPPILCAQAEDLQVPAVAVGIIQHHNLWSRCPGHPWWGEGSWHNHLQHLDPWLRWVLLRGCLGPVLKTHTNPQGSVFVLGVPGPLWWWRPRSLMGHCILQEGLWWEATSFALRVLPTHSHRMTLLSTSYK